MISEILSQKEGMNLGAKNFWPLNEHPTKYHQMMTRI